MKKIDIKVVAEEETTFLVEVVKNDKNVKGKIQRYTVENDNVVDGGDNENNVVLDNDTTTKKRYGKKYPNESKW